MLHQQSFHAPLALFQHKTFKEGLNQVIYIKMSFWWQTEHR